MIHPLFKMLATQPQLLVEHASAYGELAMAEAHELARAMRLRLAWWLAALLLGSLGLGLGGVAALLAAALPLGNMPWPWLLVALPATLLLAAAACAWAGHRVATGPAWQLTRAQWALDAQLAQRVNA